MTIQKSEYVAPACALVSFQVEENVNARAKISTGTAEFGGFDAVQDDFDDDFEDEEE